MTDSFGSQFESLRGLTYKTAGCYEGALIA